MSSLGLGLRLPSAHALNRRVVAKPGLLDLYPNAALAFSTRLLRDDYTGPCLRVRRSSDNAEQDIGFAAARIGGYRWLDTAELLAFVGSGDGFITTWYDQSGGSLGNATQPTAGRQLPIVLAGSVLTTAGGRPAAAGAVTDASELRRMLMSTALFRNTSFAAMLNVTSVGTSDAAGFHTYISTPAGANDVMFRLRPLGYRVRRISGDARVDAILTPPTSDDEVLARCGAIDYAGSGRIRASHLGGPVAESELATSLGFTADADSAQASFPRAVNTTSSMGPGGRIGEHVFWRGAGNIAIYSQVSAISLNSSLAWGLV